MTTQTVHFDNFDVELSQPLDDRQNVVLITTSDGRRSVIGDGPYLSSVLVMPLADVPNASCPGSLRAYETQ